jgi:polar amino acid transport system substrate-binding protein
VTSSGKIVFGTTIDYPPFESYDENFQPIGFDIALAREIGARLGLQVEFRDMPFDSMISSVQASQVHAGIAALSVTPERQEIVDFSNIYFNDKTSVLSRQGSGITIPASNDLAAYRLGVQRGTIYQDWINKFLIEPGLMAPQNLLTYDKPELAVGDLQQGSVDLVMMGSLPAEEYIEAGGVELSGESLNPQLLAIALPKGSPTFLAKVNEALNSIQADGTLAELAHQYLGVQIADEPLPPPPASNTTPVQIADSMTFVADLTIPDGTYIDPGESFTKTWRIYNAGTSTWDSSYTFAFVQGDPMGGETQSIQGTVAPGESYDMSVPMVAPTTPGNYGGLWQMVNGDGVPFGTRIWVQIAVPAPPGRPAEPTAPPPAPSIEYFTGPASVVAQGEPIILSWSFATDDVVSATLTRTNPDGSVTELYGGADVPPTGTYQDVAGAPGDYTYTLAVGTEFGGTDTATVTVSVVAAPEQPEQLPAPTPTPQPSSG